MSAELLADERHLVGETVLPSCGFGVSLNPCADQSYKYSLAYVVKGVCVLRYDNEAGKAIISMSMTGRSLICSLASKSCWRISGLQ